MCIEAALLCQAFFVLSIFFQVLMHRQSQILKNPYLWKVIYIVLIVSLVMQRMERLQARMKVGSGALAQATVLGWITQGVLGQQRGSVGALHSPVSTGKLTYVAIE